MHQWHIYLETDVVARLVDHLACLPELFEGAGDEALSAEAGVHRHQQDNVNLIENVPGVIKGRRGVEHESCIVAREVRRGAEAGEGGGGGGRKRGRNGGREGGKERGSEGGGREGGKEGRREGGGVQWQSKAGFAFLG